MPVALAAAVIYKLNAKLAKTVLVSSARTIIQLLLLSVLLKFIFQWNHWLTLLVAFSFIQLIASFTVVKRLDYKSNGLWKKILAATAGSIAIVSAYSFFTVFSANPWFNVFQTIPLIGIMTGNSLTGITLALNQFIGDLQERRGEFEVKMAFSATPWEATQLSFVAALKTGLTPIINSMMIVGLVSIPGVMAGQLLSMQSPEQAAFYQISILFLIFSCTFFSIFFVLLLFFFEQVDQQRQTLSFMGITKK